MTVNDYLQANPTPLPGLGQRAIGYGAEGRKSGCFKFDGRRKNNKVAFPVPACGTQLDSVRVRQVYVTEEESVKIGHQVRYQDRKAKQQKARYLALLKAGVKSV